MVLGCADDANELPRGVEASIWASSGWAHIVFKKRKHRPRGSWLKQKCICAKDKAKEKFCATCRLQQLTPQRARRQRSKAWLAYVNPDECEHAVLMQLALDEDSDGEA